MVEGRIDRAGKHAIIIQQRVNLQVFEEGKEVPKEVIYHAETKEGRFASLNSQIKSELKIITDKLEALKQKVNLNAIKHDGKPTGPLTCGQAEYMDALNFDTSMIEELLQRDTNYWADNL